MNFLRILRQGLLFTALTSAWVGAQDKISVDKIGAEILPEGCGNPFLDVGSFLSFYDSSISLMVAKRGLDAKGVTDLFAVAELRKELDAMFPSPSEESALDRLIISQLCQFQKIQTHDVLAKGKGGNPLRIESGDAGLHDHLATVAPKLYKDARKILVEALALKARDKQKDTLLLSKWAEIRKAREHGRAKIEDLFVE